MDVSTPARLFGAMNFLGLGDAITHTTFHSRKGRGRSL